MINPAIRVIAAAALAGCCIPAFSYKPLYENIDNLPLEDNRLTWHVWVPGESDDGDAWDPLFHESVRHWNAELPYFNLSAVTRNSEDCRRNSSGFASSRNQVNTVTWRETNCSGESMAHAAGWAMTFISGNAKLTPLGGYLVREIEEGDIFFNEMFEHADGGVEQMVYDDSSFYSVALHEIGHNLGLGHGYIDAAIMAYGPTHSMGRWRKRLSPDDICGVAVISGNREFCPVALGEAVASNGAATLAHFSGYASPDAGPERAGSAASLAGIQYLCHCADRSGAPVPHRSATCRRRNRRRQAFRTQHRRRMASVFRRRIAGRNSLRLSRTSRGTGDSRQKRHLPRPAYLHDPRHGYNLYRDALTGIRLSLEGVSLKFWVAYSSDAEPGLLVYGSEPIRVAWTLE